MALMDLVKKVTVVVVSSTRRSEGCRPVREAELMVVVNEKQTKVSPAELSPEPVPFIPQRQHTISTWEKRLDSQ